MFIHYEELYLKKQHIQLLKKEPDYVKKRYHAIAVALASKNNIIREKASQDLEISMRQFQCLLHRFQKEEIYKELRPDEYKRYLKKKKLKKLERGGQRKSGKKKKERKICYQKMF